MTKPRKHIIFLMGSMAGGGAERVILELLKNLDRSRFDPALALIRPEGPYMEMIPNDVTIIDLSRYQGRGKVLHRISGIHAMVTQYRPDLVLAGLTPPNCALLRAAPLIRKHTRMVVAEHHNLSMWLRNHNQTWLYHARRLEIRLLYRWADRVIAISSGIKQQLVEEYNLPPQTISLIPNPVDLETIRALAMDAVDLPWADQESVPMIMNVGRLVREKAQDHLLQAFALVRSQLPCRLVILGEGAQRPMLEAQARELGIAEDVYMPGFVNNPWAYMSKATVYALTSLTEGLPLTLLEAMACDLPVVATDCDYGPRDIIQHGKNGLLAPVGDIKAIADYIVTLLRNSQQRAALIKAGRHHVLDYSSPSITRRYEQLIDEILGASGQQGQ